MSGNVSEWVWDRYDRRGYFDKDYVAPPAEPENIYGGRDNALTRKVSVDPVDASLDTGQPEIKYHAIRGGSWSSEAKVFKVRRSDNIVYDVDVGALNPTSRTGCPQVHCSAIDDVSGFRVVRR
jgi:formylglycine-generating enzyme required for sulfatase activity